MSDDGELTTVDEQPPLPVATLDDPHLQEGVADPRQAEGLTAGYLVIGVLGVAVFGAAYWQNWKPWLLGLSLGIGLFFLGFGLSAWGKYLMPQGPFVEARHSLRSSRARARRHRGGPGRADRRGVEAAPDAGRAPRVGSRHLRHRGPVPAAALARPAPTRHAARPIGDGGRCSSTRAAGPSTATPWMSAAS